jgi:hypothetical protein
MAKILFGTHYISEDEPCLGLFEMNLQSPGSKGMHRYQVVYVMRGDKPAEYRKDMGQSKKFKADQLRLPGGAFNEIEQKYYVEHTVGELREIANHWRAKPTFKDRELPNVQGKTIWQKWADQLEENKNKEKGRILIHA